MFRQVLRLIINITLLLFVMICIIWHKLAVYGIQQGAGQIEMVWNARPIDDILKDANFPDSLKTKLKLIKSIKAFTIDSLGMNISDNYEAVYDQKGNPLLYTVSACEPYSMRPKKWTFPFLGTVPYKGFFDKAEARKEILQLVAEGYDVDVYSPSGWSTLGWFKDPILSSMLERNEGQLANLIIHELTHGTLFVKDSVNFNENLANFIGDKGAEQFLTSYFGINSAELSEYRLLKADEKIYDDYILKGAERLDSLYQRMGKGNSEEDTRKLKKELVMEIVVGVTRLPLHHKRKFFKYTQQAFLEGNAFFMTFKRYDSQYEIFDQDLRENYHGDLKKYLQALKVKWPSI